MFESWGGGETNSRANVFKEFMDVGFRMIFHGTFTDYNEAPIAIFALKDSPLADSFYVPPHPLILAIKNRNLSSFLRHLIKFLNGVSEKNYEPPRRQDKFLDNLFIKNLLNNPKINFDIDKINLFYQSLNKGESILKTKDEEFYDYIDQKH